MRMPRSLRATLLLWYTLVLDHSDRRLWRDRHLTNTGSRSWARSTPNSSPRRMCCPTRSLLTSTARSTSTSLRPSAVRVSAIRASRRITRCGMRGQLVDQSDPAATPQSMPAVGVTTRLARREVVIDAGGRARIRAGPVADSTPPPGPCGPSRLRRRHRWWAGARRSRSSAASFWPVGRSPRLRSISRTAGAMIGGDLDARIPVKGTASELEQVARALNEAFDRLRVAVDRQRQFTADASHELRTPLATLRAEFEWALAGPEVPDEYKSSIEKGQRAVERMTELADRLLTLVSPVAARIRSRDARSGRRGRRGCRSPEPLAAGHSVTIDASYQSAPVSGRAGPFWPMRFRPAEERHRIQPPWRSGLRLR